MLILLIYSKLQIVHKLMEAIVQAVKQRMHIVKK